MKISIRGAKNRTMAANLKLAATYYGYVLFSRQMLPFISLDIRIKKSLGYNGLCGPVDPAKPREFEIELKQMPRMNLLVTLAHEMVHCKQFAYGELKDVLVKKQLRTFWRGQDYHDVDYWDHPWEFEAFGLETSLAAKFLRDTNLYLYFGQRYKDWNK